MPQEGLVRLMPSDIRLRRFFLLAVPVAIFACGEFLLAVLAVLVEIFAVKLACAEPYGSGEK